MAPSSTMQELICHLHILCKAAQMHANSLACRQAGFSVGVQSNFQLCCRPPIWNSLAIAILGMLQGKRLYQLTCLDA